MNDLRYFFCLYGYDDYYIFSLDKIANQVYVIDKPHLYYKHIMKIICKIHLSSRIFKYINLPFKSIWLKGLTNVTITNNYPICFLLSASYYLTYVKGLVPYIRNKYKNCKIILDCTDKIDWYKKKFGQACFENVAKNCDLVLTYNILDSQNYGYLVLPPVIPKYSNFPNLSGSRKSDLLFVGRNKGRHKLLHSIYLNATLLGLKCDFTIIGVKKKDRLKHSTINYLNNISYRTVIDKINSTKCIINIPQEGVLGLSLRDYEAIGNNKYLLTNNKIIQHFDFFNKNQIIFVDDNGNANFNQIYKFVLYTNDISQKYTWENRMKFIESHLSKLE